MRWKTLDELKENEILARPILTEDFQVILPEGAILKQGYIEKLRELNTHIIKAGRHRSAFFFPGQ